jgi:hypothetical protein
MELPKTAYYMLSHVLPATRTTHQPKKQKRNWNNIIPMERVHMDILGPLPITKKGNKYPVNDNKPIYKMVGMFPVIHTYSRRSCKEIS